MRRRIRRVTGKAGHCAEQPCAGCGDLPKLQGRARCRGALFLCGVCALAARQERKGAGAEEQGKDTGHAGAQWIFCGRRWAQARARCKGAGKGAGTRAHCGFYEAGEGTGAGAQWIFAAGAGTGIQRAFCSRRGGMGAPRVRAAGIAAHSGRAYALAPGGFFPCGKKITRRQAR